MSEFDEKKKAASLQRKNLLQARLFDDEVQQEIFPVENKKSLAEDVTVQYDDEDNERFRDQKGTMDKLNTVMGDLSSWRDARIRNKGSPSSTNNEFNFNALESDNDDVSAKLSAFIEEELFSGAGGSRRVHRIDKKCEATKERLQALIRDSEVRTKATEIVDLSSLSLQNRQMTQLKTSHLGANFQGEKELEATKDHLLSQLEADDAAFEKLQAQLNASSWDDDLDRLLDEPHK